MKEYTRRNSLRLQGYDYSRAGSYFITLCTKDGEMMFGKIVDGKMELNELGRIAEEELQKTAEVRKRDFEIVRFIIMPNHVHLLVILFEPQPVGAARKPPADKSKQMLPLIIQAYKAAVTRKLGFSLWQRSYYENILHDKEEAELIRRYIENNPATWEKDRFYCN